MTARFPVAVAKPVGDVEGQVIVVIFAATDEDLKAFGHAYGLRGGSVPVLAVI